MIKTAEIIELLDLKAHPSEGGYFRETLRSPLKLTEDDLGPDYQGERSAGTAIYYLLTKDTYSAIHRLPGEEIFHFYLGDPVEMLWLLPDGTGKIVQLGTDLAAGGRPQVVVPGGVWQGSRLVPGGEFALLGTTMTPGFDFQDFEHGNRGDLLKAYPAFVERILGLTPGM